MGQNITVTYEVGVSKNNAYNKIVISAGSKQFSFGNDGCTGEIKFEKEYQHTIFIFFLPFPFSFISVGCYVKGSVSGGFGVKIDMGANSQFWAKAEGSLILGAEVKAGFDAIASLSAFAEGTIVAVSGQVIISNLKVDKDTGFKLTVGKLVVGIRGCLFWFIRGTIWQATLFEGWTIQ